MTESEKKRNLAAEVREFLSTRRARITPEQAGLPVFGGKRRVAGLRREEVALLAGMSVDYYVRLERGTPAEPPTRPSKLSRTPCSSTRPSAPTSTTWLVRPLPQADGPR